MVAAKLNEIKFYEKFLIHRYPWGPWGRLHRWNIFDSLFSFSIWLKRPLVATLVINNERKASASFIELLINYWIFFGSNIQNNEIFGPWYLPKILVMKRIRSTSPSVYLKLRWKWVWPCLKMATLNVHFLFWKDIFPTYI